MNRDGALRPAPEDLGQAADIDSFAVEAGVILLERFCALDRVVRNAQGWSVPVTDLQRHLGHAPHHRLRMEFLRCGDGEERKLRRAVRLVTDVQPIVHGWIRARDGVVLLTDPITGSPATTPLTDPEAITVALALTATLSQLHAAGVTGVAFSTESLHVLGREVTVVGYEHLAVTGTAEEDVHRLVDLLEFLSGGVLADTLRPTPTTALELWERTRSRQGGAGAQRFALPATPPFVGRDEVLARLMDAARRARNGTAQLVLVRGDAGMGRTRLLRRFEVEVDRWVDALVAAGGFKAGAPEALSGFVEVIDTLARHPTTLGTAEHEAVRERIRSATGTLIGIVAALSPAIGAWLGTTTLPSNLLLNERFGQHAATVAAALRAVGTARRPLIVLLDDMDLADPGSRAVLHELMTGPSNHHTLIVATCAAIAACLPEDAAPKGHLEIGPFDRLELRDLLDRSMPGPLADPDTTAEILWRATRGHPQEAWGALQEWALRDAWFLDEAIGAWRLRSERIEESNKDPYLARWEAFPPHQQWLVLVAALRAGRATVPWLVQVMGWNETEVRNAVQAAVEAALLVAEPDGGLRFASHAVRRMVEQNVTEEVKANAHRQIADWLDREPGSSIAQRAWHRELSRITGRDERLAGLHIQGGEELMRIYDLERARWHFEKALTRATSPAIWVDALEGRGDVALLEGRTDQALDDYLQGMTYGGDPIRGLEIAAKAIQGFYKKDAPQAAYDLASAALRLAEEPLPTTRLGSFFAVIGAVIGLWGRSARSTRVRDALCRVYTYVTGSLITERPVTAIIAVLRGARHARGLDTENAAAILALYSALRGALGHTRAAARINEEAEAVAKRSQKPWGLGVVYHVRSQNQLGQGLYQQASDSLNIAVEQFRAAGDLSIAVFSYTFRAIYGRENEPASKVLSWIREAESFSRRQGSHVGLYAVSSLRSYIGARRGLSEAADEALRLSNETLALELGNIDLVNAHAFLSLAFVHLGDVDRAWAHAKEAVGRLNAGPAAADYMRDAYIATVATVLAAPQPTLEQQRAFKKSLRALYRAGKRSPRLAAAWRLYAAKDAMRRARVDEAAALLEEVISTHAVHRQAWYALEAHRLLAELRQGSSVAEADAHRQQAHALAVALEIEAPMRAPARPVAQPIRGPEPAVDRIEIPALPGPPPNLPPVRVDPIVRRLLPAFERALPRRVALKVDIEPDSQVACNPESLQLLVVNLVLAARDTLREEGEIRLTVKSVRLDQAESARLPGVRIDAHLLVETRAIGLRRSDTISGVGICSEITASIGGFVDVHPEGPEVLVVAAYLATRSTPHEVEPEVPAAEEAVVLHSDARMRQTVVSALRDLGLRADGIDPHLHVEGRIGADQLVFAEAEWLQGRLGRDTVRGITLYARGAPAPVGNSLRVPFTIGELQEVVARLSRPDSSE